MPKKTQNRNLIAESIEFVSTTGPITDDLKEIPNKNANSDQFHISETETEVAITLRRVVLHTTTPRGDTSLARGITKSLRNEKDIHSLEDGSIIQDFKNGKSKLKIPLHGLKEVIAKAKSQGKSVRLCIPKEGVPVFFGDDWNEHYNALQKKRRR